MQPITFSCEATLGLPPEEIARQILDMARWLDFQGCWPVPGIKAAEFEVRTPQIVGSRIRVLNTDGSRHIEEIVEWHPGHRIRLRMTDFSAPLSRLATRIEETWEFERAITKTKVRRTFKIQAKSPLAWPVLWVLASLLKKGISRHLRQMRSY